MTTRSTYTAPRTPSTPSFRLPAPHARASLDADAVRSPLLTPVEENTRALGNDAPQTTWQRCRQSLAQFGAKNTGLMLVIASQAFYSAMNVFVKILNKLDPPVPPLELIFVRQIITYVCCTSYMVITKVPHPFLGPPGARHLLVFRGFSGFFGLFGVYFSLQYLSLSDATVITFLAPTCTAIAGAVLLKEKLRIAELWAALVSLFGVILIARPAFIFGHSTASDGAEGGVTPAQRFAAVCVALFGVLGATGAYVSIRAIGHRAHAMHSLTSFSSTCVVAASLLSLLPSTPTLPTEWTIPSSREHILLMFLIGALGFVAQALMTTGLQRETAGRGSMGMYAQIVFAGLYDALVFHTRMNALSMTGTMLIVGSALYVAVTKKVTKPAADETAKIEAAEAGAATEEEGLLSAAEPIGGADESVPEPAIVSMGPVSREGTMRGAPKGLSDDR